MIDLLSSTQILLREVGFSTRLISMEPQTVLRFEDESIMGFVVVFDQAVDIRDQWKRTETVLLTKYAPSFRAAGEKAWNVYTVFLSTEVAPPEVAREITRIEEDLERTRKLASSGIVTREELTRTLLPILPLQFQPSLQPEDVTERLRRRIRTIAPKAAQIALSDDVPVIEVVRLLGEQS